MTTLGELKLFVDGCFRLLCLQAISECVAKYSHDEERKLAFRARRLNEIVESGVGAAADPKDVPAKK